MANVWRYRGDGVDLGSAWSASDFDDSAWASGAALFFAPISTVNYPVPKNTFLPVTNNAGTRIITFYFRTQFLFNGDTNDLRLGVRGVIDDGAVLAANHAIPRRNFALQEQRIDHDVVNLDVVEGFELLRGDLSGEQ